MASPVTVSERSGGKYTLDVRNGRHHLYADEPLDFGSADLGPSPFEYLCASLGSCTVITLRMYAGRKGWPVDHIAVRTEYGTRPDDAGGDPINVFTRILIIEGKLEEEQLSRMMEIANRCPVHRLLESGNEILTFFES
ncbi:MAG: OsmC family protein [Pseudomonadota bacterium]